MKGFVEGAVGNPGGWSAERLAKVPVYKQQIVEMVAAGMFLSEIASEIGVTQITIRNWRRDDRDFDAAFIDSESAVTDSMEKEAVRRARDGVLEPVVCAGKLVLNKDGTPLMSRKYSDPLLMFMLRGRRSEVYGDKRELSGKIGIDVVGARSSLEAKFAAAQEARNG